MRDSILGTIQFDIFCSTVAISDQPTFKHLQENEQLNHFSMLDIATCDVFHEFYKFYFEGG